MELIEKIKEEFKVFEDKKKGLVEDLRKQFPELLKPLMEKSSVIESISWTQYTPYFNDGDECIFGVNNNEDCLEVNGFEFYSDEFENLGLKEYYWNGNTKESHPKYNPQEYLILESIAEVLTSIPDEFYKDLFGDHVKVTIYKDGKIEVDTYEHD